MSFLAGRRARHPLLIRQPWLTALLVAVIVSVAAGCPAWTSGRATVQGVVRNAAGEGMYAVNIEYRPLANQVIDHTGFATQHDGSFRKELQSGPWEIRFISPEAHLRVHQVDLAAAETLRLDVAMPDSGPRVTPPLNPPSP